MSPHIGDNAELFALGVLDPAERVAIEAHLAGCGACSQRVARNERVVAALGSVAWDETTATSHSARLRVDGNARSAWFAAAAALTLAAGLGGTLVREHANLATIVATQDTALATVASSHFLHASFLAQQSNAPPAKLLFGRDGEWLYIIVDAAHPDWRVRAEADGNSVMDLGRLQSVGATSVLFARPGRRIAALRLIDSTGAIVSRLNVLYPQRIP